MADSNFESNCEFIFVAASISTGISSSFSTSNTLSSKLLDVKESDDEDNGSAPVYARFTQGYYILLYQFYLVFKKFVL